MEIKNLNTEDVEELEIKIKDLKVANPDITYKVLKGGMPSEKPAINVIKESADIYYGNLEHMPKDLKKQISCYMLDEIFKNMVIPAIDKARSLDRNACI